MAEALDGPGAIGAYSLSPGSEAAEGGRGHGRHATDQAERWTRYQCRLRSWMRAARPSPRQPQRPPRRHRRRRPLRGSLPERPGARRSNTITRWTSSSRSPRRFPRRPSPAAMPRLKSRPVEPPPGPTVEAPAPSAAPHLSSRHRKRRIRRRNPRGTQTCHQAKGRTSSLAPCRPHPL